MLHIVKIPNNEGDINNMRKFILGLSFLGFGDIGFLIVFTYTLFHQSIINGSEGWLINLIANDTLIPVVFFSLWIITGIIISITLILAILGNIQNVKENYNKEKSENIDSVAYCILYLFHDSILIQKTAKYTLL